MNNHQNLKEVIDTQLSELKVSEKMKQNILKKSPKKKLSAKRITAIAAAALITVTGAIGVGAAAIPQFRQAIMGVYLSFQPVNQVAEKDGIRLEITRMGIEEQDGKTIAAAYFTMKDLTGQNRLNGTVDFNDPSLDVYSVFAADFAALHCDFVGYDEATQTATGKISVVQEGADVDFSNTTVRFTVRDFLNGEIQGDYETGINLYEQVMANPKAETEIMSLDEYGGGTKDEADSETTILKRDEMRLEIPGVNYFYISNIGIVDGKLHIQMKKDFEQNFAGASSGLGYPKLIQKDGSELKLEPEILYFGEYQKENCTYGGLYNEYIFDIGSVEELKDLELDAYIHAYENDVEGPWELQFKFDFTKDAQ